MITINNKIDFEIVARIYYKNDYIGTCENELAFLDVRKQIKECASEDYSFELVKLNSDTGENKISERIKFKPNGRFVGNEKLFQLYWNGYDDLLSALL